MQEVYSRPDRAPALRSVLLLAGAAVVALFLVVPFANLLSSWQAEQRDYQQVNTALPPPPPPPTEPPPPQDEQQQEEEPELEQPPPLLDLAQLDLALNAGMGNAATSGFAAFDPNFDALAEMRIFELSELDKHPVAISRNAPIYPYELKRNRVEGTVSLQFIVDNLGNVREIKVESSTHRQFEDPAIDAVRNWKFDPGIKDGEAVATRVRQKLDFSVN